MANNTLGAPLVGDLLDPGTVLFANQSYPASSGEGSQFCLAPDADGQFGPCVEFSMTDMSAGAVLTPVPEPATYALMLAGLWALGIAAHRRRAQA